MKKNSTITLLTVILSTNLVTTFEQTTSDKIIFLTDFYTTFADKVKADDKNVYRIYKEEIQTSICDKYFQKSEYADIVKDFFVMPITSTPELTKSIDRIALNQETIKTKIIGALKSAGKILRMTA